MMAGQSSTRLSIKNAIFVSLFFLSIVLLIAPNALAAGWSQVNADGFGAPDNRWADAMTMFNGYMYAATGDNTSTGSGIWRSIDGTSWGQVGADGLGDANNKDVYPAAVLNGKLYIVTWNMTTGAEVWRSTDGTSFEQINVDGFGDSKNSKSEVVAVDDPFIYVGTGNVVTGAQIWRYSESTTWTQVNDGGFGDTNNQKVTPGVVYGGNMYTGTQNNVTGGEVWRYSPSETTWTQINLDGFGDAGNRRAGPPAIFNGQLYVGAGRSGGGAGVYRYLSGTNWTTATVPGFGDANNVAARLVANVWSGQLFSGTFNTVTGAEIWKTIDGNNWQQVNSDGFGDANNIEVWPWLIENGFMYAGTYNAVTGGEIWRSDVTAPSTMLETSPTPADGTNDWFKTVPLITLNRNEPGVSYMQFDSTNPIGFAAGDTTEAPEGEHTLYYYSVDNAGNTETVQNQPLKVDSQAPGTPTLSGDATVATVNLSWSTSTDSISGLAGYGIYDADTDAKIAVAYEAQYKLKYLNPSTVYRYYVRAVDNAGNLSVASNVIELTTPAQPDNAWWTNGPFFSSVKDLAISSSGSVAYAATANMGIAKSTDNGTNWKRTTTRRNDKAFFSVAVDQTDSNIAYGGSWPGRIYKTTNGGQSWHRLNTGISSNTAISSLVIDPADHNIIYAGLRDNGGVLRSADGGANWSVINNGLANLSVHDLAVDPGLPATVYAGTAGGLFKSTDSGQNWSYAGPAIAGIRAIAINPANPSDIFVAAYAMGVYRSLDGGNSWNLVNTGLPSADVEVLAIDPTAPSTVYVGFSDAGVYKTSNAGENWAAANADLTNTRIRALAVNPADPTAVYAATLGGGIFRSPNAGATWHQTNAKYLDVSAQAVIADPLDSERIYTAVHLEGAGQGDVFMRTGPDQGWSDTGVTSYDMHIEALALDPSDVTSPTTVYAASRDFYRSDNGGASWTNLSNGLPSDIIKAVVVDPTSPDTIYVGTTNDQFKQGPSGVYKTADGGQNWSIVNTGLTASRILGLAIDPGNPLTLYAASDQGIFKTSDGGSLWTKSSSGTTGWDANAVAVDPTDTSTVYAATGDGVYKSIDAGANWYYKGLAGTGPKTLAIDPTTTTIIFAGTNDNGVLMSIDGGESWKQINQGLTNQSVRDIEIIPSSPRRLHAATEGGVFTMTLTQSLGFELKTPANGAAVWNSQPTLSWQPAVGAAKYQLFVDGSLNRDNISASVTSAKPIAALGSGAHDWYIKAVDSSGAAESSLSTRTFTIDPAPGTWAQVNLDGFGETNNQENYSGHDASGRIYFGTTNMGTGGQLWRSADGADWTQVGFNGFGDSRNKAIWIDSVFSGSFYAGTWNPYSGGQVWRSGNGTAWDQVVSDGFGSANNFEIDPKIAFGGYLFAGTQTRSGNAELRRSSDGATWAQVGGSGFGDPNNGNIQPRVVFDGRIYASTGNGRTGGEIWRSPDGTTWEQANQDGFGNLDNQGVSHIAEFNGNLYAGTNNGRTGTQIWRSSDGTNWSMVVEGGFDDANNEMIGAFYPIDGKLYAGTRNVATGTEIWRSSDGSSWAQVNTDGFGDPNNIRAHGRFTKFGQNIYIGVDNKVSGGSVWALKIEDTTPPISTLETSPIVNDGDNSWFKTIPIVTLMRNEPGVSYMQFDSTNPVGFIAGDTTTAPEGQHTLYYYSVDAVGNTETVQSLAFKVDTQAPVAFDQVSPTNDATSNRPYSYFSWQASTDTVSGLDKYQLYLDGLLSRETSGNITSAVPSSVMTNGSHTWYVRAKDVAGNYRDTATRGLEIAGGAGKITYVSDLDHLIQTDNDREIFLMNADGANKTNITNNSWADISPAFSPDGSKIALASRPNGPWDIYTMNSNGSDLSRVTTDTNAAHNDPAWSPDGQRIAFARQAANENSEIWIMDADGSNKTRLTVSTGGGFDGDFGPVWSPDGARIAFTGRHNEGDFEIYIMNADGSNIMNLSNNSVDERSPSFSPDGGKIAFVSLRDGGERVYLMDINGAGLAGISGTSTEDSMPTWSPDGEKIGFVHGGQDSEIYIMDANGANRANITNSPISEFFPSWGPGVVSSSTDTPSWNLVTNPGFETGDFTGWNASTTWTVTSTDSHSGSFSALYQPGIVGYINDGAQPLHQNNIQFDQGKWYTVSAWLKQVDTADSTDPANPAYSPNHLTSAARNNGVYLNYGGDQGRWVPLDPPVMANEMGWVLRTRTYFVPQDATHEQVGFRFIGKALNLNSRILIDDVSIIEETSPPATVSAGAIDTWVLQNSNNQTQEMVEDDSGHFWIGMGWGGGIIKWLKKLESIETSYPAGSPYDASTIKMSAAGDIMYASWDGDKVGVLDPDTGTLDETATPLNSEPVGPSEDDAGNFWFAEHLGGTLARWDRSAGTIAKFTLPLAGAEPGYLIKGQGGKLWFTNQLGGGLGYYDTGTNSFGPIYSVGPSNSWPAVISQDSGGKIWVPLRYGNKVVKFDPSTETTVASYDLPTPLSGPQGTAIDRLGNVWVAQSWDGSIAKIDPNTGAITEYRKKEPGANTKFLYADKNGDIWFGSRYQGTSPKALLNRLKNTQPGANVKVGLFDQDAKNTRVLATFDNISAPGETSATTQTAPASAPGGMTLAGNTWDVGTSASYSGNINIGISYDETSLAGSESSVKLLHYAGGSWVDITTSLDTTNNIVYGQTSSLSAFSVALNQDVSAPSTPTVAGFAPSATQITLSWAAATDNVGVAGYKIYDADTDSQVATTTATSRTFSGLTPSTFYAYYIRAFDDAGNVSGAGNVVRIKPGGAGDTPADTTVAPVTVLPNYNVSLTFDDVTAGGSTNVTVTPAPPGGPTSGFDFLGNQYDITTTASFVGPILISLRYNDADVSGNEADLKIFHFEGGAWKDVTLSVDSMNNIVTGQVTSLSPFILGGPAPAPATGVNENALIVLALLAVSLGAAIIRNRARVRR